MQGNVTNKELTQQIKKIGCHEDEVIPKGHSTQEAYVLQIAKGEYCELFEVQPHVPKANGRCICNNLVLH